MDIRFLLLFILIYSQNVLSCDSVIDFSDITEHERADMSTLVREKLLECTSKDIRIIFSKNTYYFRPEGSFNKNCAITNHENGEKNIAFLLEHFNSVLIEGNDSEFIFSKEMAPFVISNSQNIQIKNIRIDWDVPFYLQGEIVRVNPSNNYYDVRMDKKGFSYKIDNKRLIFPLSEKDVFSGIGESLIFDKDTKSPVNNAGSFDFHRKNDVEVKNLQDGSIRFYEKISSEMPLGGIITFKGPMGENRYAPAIHAINSKNISVTNVKVYHALGMGFLGERTENINLDQFDVCLREGTNRIISSTADATHFCNCRGDIVVENCLFENMLDDGTNIHGTYVKIDSVMNSRTVIAALQHFQQSGFQFADKDEEVWFLISPSRQRSFTNRVVSCKQINDIKMEISFSDNLPKGLKQGDLIENKTWNAKSFILRNCVIRNHRARNIVLKTPGNTLIENNQLHSMMASILLRGEGAFWYESGANENIIIRNNKFDRCTYGGKEHAVLHVLPRFSKDFNKTDLFDKNIVFENNTLVLINEKVVEAHTVDGLKISNNTLKFYSHEDHLPDQSPVIKVVNSRDVSILKNEVVNQKKGRILISNSEISPEGVSNNKGFVEK